MSSDLFKVNYKDVARGATNAVFLAVLAAFVGIVGNSFDLFTANWTEIGKIMANVGFISFVSHLGGVFLSDKQGKIFGRM